ncbi:hypothetical protein INH39_16770 [Massilia violaceinigra]|uniref:DUF2782 domain-containing protein n=1 Tax=Massilia violaceinigra TaxID=2045208 RepID=A0ABY4AEA7_9BURK|nr:DUF2782 domain-containing protein [Massilia violaceinigra]UOD33141.1 hypothetical protein INH39_16770 [Massilia violaceinigra]
MLRISSFRTTSRNLLALCLLASASLAGAQQPKPSDAPPKLERLDDGNLAPAIVAPRANEPKISEKRENGRTTEVKVKSGKSSYTMKGTNPAAGSSGMDANGSNLRGPQWQVGEFDLNKKKKAASEAAADAAPVPAPPAGK